MDRFLQKRSNAKAEENKKKERELDELIPIDDLMDPYATDEEDEYVLPSTKRQKPLTLDKVNKVKESTESELNKKKKRKPRKQLSRVERLERLKMKTKMFEETKKAQQNESQNQKDQTFTSSTQINHDAFFKRLLPPSTHQGAVDSPNQNKTSCVVREHITSTNTEHKEDSPCYVNVTVAQDKVVKNNTSGQKKIDDFMDQCPVVRPHVEKSEVDSMRTTVKQTMDSTKPDVYDTLSLLMSKMDELNASVGLLRRQVARVEAKSQFASRAESTGISCTSYGDKTDDIFFDFDAVCKREGFPIQTIGGVDNFERKLKDPSYTQKIVSYIYIVRIILSISIKI